MSYFCSNCGTQLNDGAAFCSNCGAAQSAPKAAPVNAEPVAAPVTSETPVPPATPVTPVTPVTPAAPAAAPVKDPKKLLIPVLTVVAVIAIIIAVVALGGGKSGGKGNTYEDAIENYMNVSMLGKISKSSVKAVAPESYWEYYEDKTGDDFEEYYEELKEDLMDYEEELEDRFGKNIKFSYKITREKELTKKKLGYIADYIEDTYDMDGDSLTAGYELDLEYVITGSEDDYEQEVEDAYVLQIDGQWYVANVDLDGEDTTVYFLID